MGNCPKKQSQHIYVGIMKTKSYTLFIASSATGRLRRVNIPFYVVHLLSLLVFVGGLTVMAAVSSYSRMLWKVTDYNAMRRDETNMKQQYHQLQSAVKDTNQRLDSLQSLASEVAVTYGITRLPQSPFNVGNPPILAGDVYQQSVAEFRFLEKTPPVARLRMASQTSGLLPALRLSSVANLPSIWPVRGLLTGHFGERMDPFSGEGAFHSGVDIGTAFGEPVEATADGVVSEVANRGGYGRVVIIDHGFGLSTWYAHLSAYNTQPGMQVKRGDIIGYVGRSGRATAPHLHYEVRLNNTPVNPWRYLYGSSTGD
jgi:murein DD-endopeptidase MepM/ murein hydrolase activator NlpD